MVNTIENTTNPLSLTMNQAKNVIAEFIAQWTLTTSVSGNGTISPSGANIYDDGTTVDLTVTPDPDNEIDRVEEDGTPISSPYQVLMDASKTVIAYFVALITAIQDVFGTTPITELGLNYWPDASGNNNKVQIKNVQAATFDNISYISGNFTGLTISSYEGTATPSKTNDSRIDVTSGLIYSITLSDGKIWYAQESNGVDLYFTDQLGNILIATFTGGTLTEFWSVKSNAAYPALAAYGGSKELECDVAGTTSILASPDGSNLGSESVVNGGFDTDISGWVDRFGTNGNWSSDNGGALEVTLTADAFGTFQQINIPVTIGIPLLISGFVKNVDATLVRITVWNSDNTGILFTDDITEINHYTKSELFFTPTTNTITVGCTVSGLIGQKGYFDNISVKEVTAIPAYGEQIIGFTKKDANIVNLLFTASQPTAYNVAGQNGYLFQIFSNEGMYYYRVTNGAVGGGLLLGTTDPFVSNDTYYEIKRVFSNVDDSHTLYIKGGIYADWTLIPANSGANPATDNTFTTTKFVGIESGVLDISSRLSKDGQRYDVNNFIDGTGTFGVRYIIGVGGGLDAKGNDLEFPANTVWNCENTYDGIQITGKETDQTADDVLVIENSATVVITKDTDLRYVSNLEISE